MVGNPLNLISRGSEVLRPLGALIAVVCWNGPLVAGLWVGGSGFGRGALIGGFLLAAWLLAAWFSTAWRKRFFELDAATTLTDEKVLGSAAGVVGMGILGYVLL